jgi:amino acid adenylation domain-containing protein
MGSRDNLDYLNDVAIIGMAGRFPGAANIMEFWQNLKEGVESISHFTDEELIESGIDASVLVQENYVKAMGLAADIEYFDAAFFGYQPAQASIIDPQHRLFLECAWESFECAGYDPMRYRGVVGVYAGSGISTYLLNNLQPNRDKLTAVSGFQLIVDNDKDFLSSRVSYKLNLKGPGLAVQTACSTSLVAIHLACQSLLDGECDMALAGGVTLRVPQKSGYFYLEGGIDSPDGRCRAFDAQAQGTVTGQGVGVVLLKRLDRALEDRDNIYAVIKGSAVNNDGSVKVGFTAPSVEGQARVISEALAMAGAPAESISYVEAHGTGTILGDPIEVRALSQAFSEHTERRGFCALGSVKTNIGHLDTAAGVAGLIKTALALRNRQLPPSLHFRAPNPEIDFENSPFYVNTELKAWEVDGGVRRAGVSSFGIGGTNAHLILEEAPQAPSSGAGCVWQILPLSARSERALEKMAGNLAARLEGTQDDELADVAYTLQVGRREFDKRRAVVCRDVKGGIESLNRAQRRAVVESREGGARVVYLYPGQGAQRLGMGLGLSKECKRFREELERSGEILRREAGLKLEEILSGSDVGEEEGENRLTRTSQTQPALAAVEYALSAQMEEWGVTPVGMLGHSLGEYVAACVSGVMSLEECLRLVSARGRMMERAPEGAMLSVGLSEEEAKSRLRKGLWLAAVNGEKQSVISGEKEEIEKLEKELEKQGVWKQRLKVSHAFHSGLLKGIRGEYERELRGVNLKEPGKRYISNVSGTWIGRGEATETEYWIRQMEATVRFWDGVREVEKEGEAQWLEMGPGEGLNALLKMNGRVKGVMSAMGKKGLDGGEVRAVMEALGGLWESGVKVKWEKLPGAGSRKRVELPTYPFERQRYWIDPPAPRHVETHYNGGRPRTDRQTDGTHMDFIETSENKVNGKGPRNGFASDHARRGLVRQGLIEIFSQLFGKPISEPDLAKSFIDLGADSLLMIQASQLVQERFGVKISFRQIMEELTTIESLAAHLSAYLPVEDSPAPAPMPSGAQFTEPGHSTLKHRENDETASPALERIMAQQLQVMAKQLDLLRGAGLIHKEPLSESKDRVSLQAAPVSAAGINKGDLNGKALNGASRAPEPSTSRRVEGPLTQFVPYQPINTEPAHGLSRRQREHLAALIARFNERTRESKRLAQASRSYFADNRTTARFRRLTKEMVYPIVGERSAGARVWDVDHNEYVDITMGFGVHLFGHSAPFIREAIDSQLDDGIHLGPQSNLAGEVAGLICELTGMERVAFCNSGTEAVMTAMRLARAATGRSLIAIFTGSYHGGFDGVLARARMMNGSLEVAPMAPGVTQHLVGDVMLLDYGATESLDLVRRHAGELAAVLVEPVQSRRPDLQPKEFLKELRKVTAESGIALIFDEIITGFRIHPGGAQAWFGVQADIATYGKVIGGGMPIGVVAGKASYMDGIDGGMWNYGDDSYPQSVMTFFAGTFCKHPLAMAAARAVLKRMKLEGPSLQQRLNERAARLADTLSDYFKSEELPIRIAHFGSQFRFMFSENLDLLFYHLLDQGVYVWEGFTCFLSTAHSDEDIEYLIKAVKGSVEALRAGGFLPDAPPAGRGVAEKTNDSEARSLDVSSVSAGARAGEHGQAPDVERIPLTEAQKQLWLLATFGAEASLAYNEPVSLELVGTLRVDALREAFQRVVDRHEALRTTIHPAGDFQLIHPRLKLEIPLIDFSIYTADEQDNKLSEWMKSDSDKSFDMTQGPLIRVSILKLEAARHLLVINIHHIITDARSLGALMREVSLIYSALCRGEDCYLPLPAPFKIYVQSLLDQGESRQWQVDEEYWLKALSGAIARLELPADHPRPQVKTYRGARREILIDRGASVALKKFSKGEGCTLFMTLLAAYALLLHRLTRQSDLLIGIGATGESINDNRVLIGYCVNVLPIRSRLDGNPAFSDFLANIRGLLLDAYDHRGYPMAMLTSKLNLQRDPRWSPLINTTFNLDPIGAIPEMEGLQTREGKSTVTHTKFDLSVNVAENLEGLLIAADFNTDLFHPETIYGILGGMRSLLLEIVAAPDRNVRELSFLTEAERRRLFEDWNERRREYPREKGVQEVYHEETENREDEVALVAGGAAITFRELNRRANHLAHYLIQKGVGPESVVGLMTRRGVEMVVGMLGIIKAGGAYLPLDSSYPPERLDYMIRDCEASVVVCEGGLWDELERKRERGGEERIVRLDEDWEEISKTSGGDPEARANGENLAYVIYTSGSTGKAKGVMVEHRAVMRLVKNADYAELGPGTVIAQGANASFDATTFEVWGGLLNGGRVVILEGEVMLSARRLKEAVREQRVNVMFVTTALFNQLVREDAGVFRELDQVFFGGEAVDARRVREVLKNGKPRRLGHVYGPTENTTFSTWEEVREVEEAAKRAPIGRAVSNTEVYVLGEDMEPRPAGVRGELYAGGDGLARGYRGDGWRTAEKFTPNPYGAAGSRLYRSGDEVRMLSGGEIEFIGRRDGQVKLRGYRIELGEVESVMKSHAGVRDGVAVLSEDEGGEKRLVGYVVMEDGKDATVAELQSYLRERLPEYMTPSALMPLEKIPLNANGKLDRDALPKPELLRYGSEMDFVAPRSTMEESLQKIFTDTIGVDRAGVFDNFFELGGDSIKATRLASRVRELFQIELPLGTFFERPTIAELAEFISLRQVERLDEGETSQYLTALEQLSDEEVNLLLGRKTGSES